MSTPIDPVQGSSAVNPPAPQPRSNQPTPEELAEQEKVNTTQAQPPQEPPQDPPPDPGRGGSVDQVV